MFLPLFPNSLLPCVVLLCPLVPFIRSCLVVLATFRGAMVEVLMTNGKVSNPALLEDLQVMF